MGQPEPSANAPCTKTTFLITVIRARSWAKSSRSLPTSCTSLMLLQMDDEIRLGNVDQL